MPEPFRDLAVARPGMLGDDHEHAHGAICEAHVQAFERVPVTSGSARAPCGRDPGCRPAQFPTRRPRAKIRKHDHAHQRTEQIRERLRSPFEHTYVQHGEDRTDDAFGRHLRRFASSVGRDPSTIDHLRELVERFRATVEYPLARPQRLDNAQLCQSGSSSMKIRSLARADRMPSRQMDSRSYASCAISRA